MTLMWSSMGAAMVLNVIRADMLMAKGIYQVSNYDFDVVQYGCCNGVKCHQS